MSWQTHTGIPAYSNEQNDFYVRKRNHFLDQLGHLKDCPDFNKLMIPSVAEYKKYDHINPIHPLHLENVTAFHQKQGDEEKAYRLKCKYERKDISEDEYNLEVNKLELNKLTRTLNFGDEEANIYPLDKNIIKQISEINLLIKNAEERKQESTDAKESDQKTTESEQPSCEYL